MSYPARHISITIDCEPATVAEFAGNPANLPQWAAGLSAGIRNEGGRWITDSPMGTVEVRFTDGIAHGILDHDVILPDGTCLHNPMRVLQNGDASEIVFTLYQLPDMSPTELENDAALIRDDLLRLREILQQR